jgi:hypothetical protein
MTPATAPADSPDRTVEMFRTRFTIIGNDSMRRPMLRVESEKGPIVFVRHGHQWRSRSDAKRTSPAIEGMLSEAYAAITGAN